VGFFPVDNVEHGDSVLSSYDSCPGAFGKTVYLRRCERNCVALFVPLASAILIAGYLIGLFGLSPTLRAASIPALIATAPNSWEIEGALTEACTCSVPCTCNFGEGPSPHDYCYALYSYEIRKGRYDDLTLDGLHFGATDLKNGRTIFIDERANERQREALCVILARVILRTTPQTAEARAKEIANDVRYVAINQQYDSRHNRLEIKGIGEFSADYIMGLDKTQPLIVRNNTTWRIHDAIKSKTSIFRVKVGKSSINTRNTNSNQGDFNYSGKMDFGSPVEWSCGACAGAKEMRENGEAMCGM